jgi:hypothetical protein
LLGLSFHSLHSNSRSCARLLRVLTTQPHPDKSRSFFSFPTSFRKSPIQKAADLEVLDFTVPKLLALIGQDKRTIKALQRQL